MWYPTTVPTGIAVLRYNLAVAYAIRGELDKSGETLKQVIRIWLLYVYILYTLYIHYVDLYINYFDNIYYIYH